MAAAQPSGGEVDLGRLSMDQLSNLRQQHEQEMNELSSNWRTLKDAQARLENSKQCLNTIGAQDGREILVPLTASLYVPGTISDSSKVLVDVGTGYYVEKSVAKAKELLDRKTKLVTANADTLQEVHNQKQRNLESIYGVMQSRMKAMQAAREEQMAGT